MPTKLVAILNLTPDSFSDGGKFCKKDEMLAHLRQMLCDGADAIDVGAESTRPNAEKISEKTEWSRLQDLLPLALEEVTKFNRDHKKQVEISIDTYHYLTARKAYEFGVKIINDVSGLQDEKIIELVAQNPQIKAVFMHSLSVPANPEIIVNQALNVTQEILRFAREKIEFLQKKGVKKSQLIFDPGVGFSKNSTQSLRIIKNIDEFQSLDLPIYIGHSKKSFLDALNIEGLSNDKNSRAQKTLIISQYLARKSVDFIRVHDVLENKKMLQKNQINP